MNTEAHAASDYEQYGALAAPGTVSKGQVLLVTDMQPVEREALFRAVALSHVLSTSLGLVHLMPDPPMIQPVLPHLANAAVMESGPQQLAKLDALAAFVREFLPTNVGALRLHVRRGEPFTALLEAASELEPRLVVVSGDANSPWRGSMVSGWVARSGIPMLVARPQRRSLGFIVEPVSDDPRRPVMRSAAALSARLETPVTIVRVTRHIDTAARRVLREKAQRIGLEPVEIVESTEEAADALLREARVRNADMIVVGARRRSWIDRVLEDDTPTQLVDRGEPSVLVVPTDEVPALAQDPAP